MKAPAGKTEKAAATKETAAKIKETAAKIKETAAKIKETAAKNKKSSPEEDRDAFRKFYSASSARLISGTEAYNRILAKEKNPLLRPLFADAADLNSGGKMLRGVLVNLGYRIAGGENEAGSDALALALEIFQTGILIHDDIIDRASLRRGKKTFHVRYAESLRGRGIWPPAAGDSLEGAAASAALCAGDLMIYEANLKIAEAYAGHPRLAEIMAEFDRIVIETIRGEMLDVILPYETQNLPLPGTPEKPEAGHTASAKTDSAKTDSAKTDSAKTVSAEIASAKTDSVRTASANKIPAENAPGKNPGILEKSVFDIYHLKTSRYSVVGPLHLGMLLGGASEHELKTIDSLADDLGVAFQIKDDLLGIFAEEENLGKNVGSDISEFKQTILYAYVREHDAEAFRKLLKFYGKKKVTKKDLEAVRAIFTDSGAKAYAEKKMEECFARAGRKLGKAAFLKEEDRAICRGFIDYSGARKK